LYHSFKKHLYHKLINELTKEALRNIEHFENQKRTQMLTHIKKLRSNHCVLSKTMLTLLIFQTANADLRFSCKYFRLHRI